MKIDIIGDVHGCYEELMELLDKLGYQFFDDEIKNNQDRTLAFLGDLTDRGPDSVKVIETCLFTC